MYAVKEMKDYLTHLWLIEGQGKCVRWRHLNLDATVSKKFMKGTCSGLVLDSVKIVTRTCIKCILMVFVAKRFF